MANPVMPVLDQATGLGKSSSTDAPTGILFPAQGASKDSVPHGFAQLANLWWQMMRLLEGPTRGQCVSLISGLNVGVFAMNYMVADVEKAYAGDASVAMTANETNYLYLDADQTLKVNLSATGWPATAHYKLAKVTTDGTTVTGIVDARWMNFNVGGQPFWSGVGATTDVDLNGFALLEVGQITTSVFPKTIAGGEIEVTGANLLVGPIEESVGVDDDLDTITPNPIPVAGNTFVVLLSDLATADITITEVDNIVLLGGPAVIGQSYPGRAIAFMDWGGSWFELWRNWHNLQSPLGINLDANAKNVSNIGLLNLKADVSTLTIASGEITRSRTVHRVDTEGGAGTDDLVYIRGGSPGDIVVLRNLSAGKVVTCKHVGGTGNDQVVLANGTDAVLADAVTPLVLQMEENGIVWTELSGPNDLARLVGSSEAIPYQFPMQIEGSLSNAQKRTWLVTHPFTLKSYRGYAIGAATGATGVVRIEKNGASVHAADADAINILDGTNSDQSATITVAFLPGDTIGLHVITAAGMTDLGVSTDAYTAAKLPS